MTDIGLMVRSANPVPDETQALTDDELSAVLLLAQQRSGGMDTKQVAPPVVEPEHRKRRGWTIAAVAAFVVILVVGGSLLLASSTSPEPPATTPPTTAAAPTESTAPTSTTSSVAQADTSVTAEERALIEAYEAAYRSGDTEGFRDLLDPGATNTALEAPDFRCDVECMLGRLVHTQGTEERLDFEGCERVADRVVCQAVFSGVLDDIFHGGDVVESYRFLILDGRIRDIERRCVVNCNSGGAPDDMRGWVLVQSSDEASEMVRDPFDRGSRRSGELWLKWAVLWDEAGRP